MTPWSQRTNNKKHGSYSSSITFFLKGRLLFVVTRAFWLLGAYGAVYKKYRL